MKPVAAVGLVLIVLGVVALAYQGFTYTSRETVIDIGSPARDGGSTEDALAATGAGNRRDRRRGGTSRRRRAQARIVLQPFSQGSSLTVTGESPVEEGSCAAAGRR
jgi:hypothetical protein